MNLQEFKKIIFDISHKLYLKIGDIHESGITPNFHVAELKGQETIYVLCNENNEWAFSSFFDTCSCSLKFIDYEKIEDVLKENYEIDVYKAKDLNGPFKKKDYMLEYDIKYWKPVTLGEGVFHWWD